MRFVIGLLLAACSPHGASFVPDGGTQEQPDASDHDPSFDTDGAIGDGGCVNLQCYVPQCPTSVSGTIFDPAGHLPLYDIAVYIPNAPLAPITDGIDTNKCDACSAPLSGNPIAVTLTDSHGHFKLDGVPVTNAPVPLVIQAGKFRRENVVLPPITACQDNPIADPQHNLRLPRNQKEGHLPLIALTTGGCDSLGCVLGHYGFGIDDSEFTASGGKGRVHVYAGDSTTDGTVAGSTSAFALWGSKALFKYDMLVANCDCVDVPRDTMGPAYQNMQTYLDHGGRLFASHWHANWFWYGPPAWNSAVNWKHNGNIGTGYNYVAPQNTCFVDSSFPKGKALDEWTQFIYTQGYATTGSTPPPGTDPVSWPTNPLSNEVNAGAIRWIYADGANKTTQQSDTGYASKFVSFNTPFSTKPNANQCGRAVYAGTHVAINTPAIGYYPGGCSKLPFDTSSATQITALEFLFFDLSSCVQDESQTPILPPK